MVLVFCEGVYPPGGGVLSGQSPGVCTQLGTVVLILIAGPFRLKILCKFSGRDSDLVPME